MKDLEIQFKEKIKEIRNLKNSLPFEVDDIFYKYFKKNSIRKIYFSIRKTCRISDIDHYQSFYENKKEIQKLILEAKIIRKNIILLKTDKITCNDLTLPKVNKKERI